MTADAAPEPPAGEPWAAVVIGASGGIGRALAAAIAASGRYAEVHGLSRSEATMPDGVRPGRIDVTDEASIRAAAGRLSEGPPLGLVVVATGLLHGPDLRPEKSWRDLDAERLLESFRVNAIGPALVARNVLPLLPRHGRAVFAALSARVGSISDNRLGGWYGYRASKAALNQLLRTLAIELARTRPDAICLGLHPGTVDTGLSRPFQAGVPDGMLFTPEASAACLLGVIDRASTADSGRVLAWDGKVVPA